MIVRGSLSVLCLIAVFLTGCKKPVASVDEPDYNQALPPGAFGLRQITDPARLPDLSPVAAQLRDSGVQQALQRSLRWFAIPSTQQFFPVGDLISHAHAHASVYALSQVTSLDELRREFDVWESVGWNGRGEVLYTAYYSPEFRASLTPTGPYQHPLYKRPSDLQTDPVTGDVLGTYPTRAQLEASGRLRGLELVYLPSALDAYIIQVNGSAKLTLTDGRVLYVGYAGTNGHEYTSLANEMIDDGKLSETGANLPAIKRYFQQHPHELDEYVRRNDRFVFFRTYDGSTWPAGSLGFRVTPMRTLATDKDIFPRGCAVLVDTTFPDPVGGDRPFRQLMFDQDTGGAIRAAGRGDIYVGIGARAENLAGRQKAPGRLYYLLLKPQRVQYWHDRMSGR